MLGLYRTYLNFHFYCYCAINALKVWKEKNQLSQLQCLNEKSVVLSFDKVLTF